MLAGKRPHLSPLDATPAFLQSLRDALAAARVRCDIVAGYTHLAPGGAAEVPVMEFQIAYVESLARLAAQLGASVIPWRVGSILLVARLLTEYPTVHAGKTNSHR